MNIFPAEIANAIVNANNNEQIAFIVILVLFFISIAKVSAGVASVVMAVKGWLRRDKNILIKVKKLNLSLLQKFTIK